MGASCLGQARKSMRPLHEKTPYRMKIIPSGNQEIPRAKNIFCALFRKQPLEKEAFFSFLAAEQKRFLRACVREDFRGDEAEVKSFRLPAEARGAKAGMPGMPGRVILFGLGDRAKWHERKAPLIARRMLRYAKSERIADFMTPLIPLFRLQTKSGTDVPDVVRNTRNAARTFAENALMAHFEFNKYKEKPKNGWPEVKTIFVGADKKDAKEIEIGIREGVIIGEELNKTRALANTPGSDMTPSLLAAAAVEAGKSAGFKVRVLDEKEITRLGMGGILGVSRGSDEKPKFIILEYQRGPKHQKPLVLCGKGVTFDTGGINLKPEQYMYEMHMDMSGGAAVIHGIAAIARLKMPINIVGLVPAVENMPSGSSYRPGDLLKSMSGKTIEVLNTDAEGRVILADTLTYSLRYKPGLIADFATLTGAAHVALGNYCSALFTNREELQEKLITIGTSSGDYVWPLPLWDEYLADIKGVFGDIANIGKHDRYGGAIHGAKFLEQFVGRTPWMHMDIAPRMTAAEGEYLAKGAAGAGVRYIVELAREYPNF